MMHGILQSVERHFTVPTVLTGHDRHHPMTPVLDGKRVEAIASMGDLAQFGNAIMWGGNAYVLNSTGLTRLDPATGAVTHTLSIVSGIGWTGQFVPVSEDRAVLQDGQDLTLVTPELETIDTLDLAVVGAGGTYSGLNAPVRGYAFGDQLIVMASQLATNQTAVRYYLVETAGDVLTLVDEVVHHIDAAYHRAFAIPGGWEHGDTHNVVVRAQHKASGTHAFGQSLWSIQVAGSSFGTHSITYLPAPNPTPDIAGSGPTAMWANQYASVSLPFPSGHRVLAIDGAGDYAGLGNAYASRLQLGVFEPDGTFLGWTDVGPALAGSTTPLEGFDPDLLGWGFGRYSSARLAVAHWGGEAFVFFGSLSVPSGDPPLGVNRACHYHQFSVTTAGAVRVIREGSLLHPDLYRHDPGETFDDDPLDLVAADGEDGAGVIFVRLDSGTVGGYRAVPVLEDRPARNQYQDGADSGTEPTELLDSALVVPVETDGYDWFTTGTSYQSAITHLGDSRWFLSSGLWKSNEFGEVYRDWQGHGAWLVDTSSGSIEILDAWETPTGFYAWDDEEGETEPTTPWLGSELRNGAVGDDLVAHIFVDGWDSNEIQVEVFSVAGGTLTRTDAFIVPDNINPVAVGFDGDGRILVAEADGDLHILSVDGSGLVSVERVIATATIAAAVGFSARAQSLRRLAGDLWLMGFFEIGGAGDGVAVVDVGTGTVVDSWTNDGENIAFWFSSPFQLNAFAVFPSGSGWRVRVLTAGDATYPERQPQLRTFAVTPTGALTLESYERAPTFTATGEDVTQLLDWDHRVVVRVGPTYGLLTSDAVTTLDHYTPPDGESWTEETSFPQEDDNDTAVVFTNGYDGGPNGIPVTLIRLAGSLPSSDVPTGRRDRIRFADPLML